MILPIYAGLERLPDSLLEASADLGAGARDDDAAGGAARAFPAVVAGSIFTFSLTLGDYIAVQIVGGANQMLGNVVYDNVWSRQQPAVRRGGGDDPGRDDAGLPGRRTPDRRPGEPVTLSPRHRAALLARQHGPRAAVHLRAAGAGGAQLVQHLAHVRLAAAGLHHAVVAGRAAQRRAPATRCGVGRGRARSRR